MISNFEEDTLNLIEENQEVIRELERAVFTNRYNLSKVHYTILSSNSIMVLYAIWEGFIQKAFGLYIDEINRDVIDLFSLCDNLIVYCHERKFRQLKEYPTKNPRKVHFFKTVNSYYSSPTLTVPRTIDTESNVGLEVLNRLLEQFNLEKYPDYWGEYKHPDPSLKDSLILLLKIRNTIAHGGELLPDETVDQSVYMRFKKLVLDLMYDIREKMIRGLAEKSYKN